MANKAEDLFKKFLYTGVGFVSMTAEKFRKTIDQLIDDNKISADEGRKIIDDFVKNTNDRRVEFEEQLKSVSERVVKGFNYPTRAEVDELKKRIEALEKAQKNSPTRKSTATKKATAKKSTTTGNTKNSRSSTSAKK